MFSKEIGSAGCLEICQAACCRDLKEFQLTQREYESLVAKGAQLFKTWDKGIYKLRGDCPNLIENRCSVHGTPEQPEICKKYGFLRFGCRATRYYNPSSVKLYLPGELKAAQGFNLRLELKMATSTLLGKWPWGTTTSSHS